MIVSPRAYPLNDDLDHSNSQHHVQKILEGKMPRSLEARIHWLLAVLAALRRSRRKPRWRNGCRQLEASFRHRLSVHFQWACSGIQWRPPTGSL